MLKKKVLLLVILISLISLLSFSAMADCVYYFYAEECGDCVTLDAYFFGLEKKYPDLKIEKYEVYHNYQNFQLMQEYFVANEVDLDSRSIPVVFTKKGYFVGKSSITSFLDDKIKEEVLSCPSLEDKAVGIIGKGVEQNVLKTLTFLRVTGSAFENIFAPGILALVLIFSAILTLIKKRENLIKKGLLFIVGIYLAYFLFSLGLFTFLYNSQLHSFFYKGIGFLALLFGIGGINAFFGTWDWLIQNVSKDLRLYVEKVVSFLLSPLGIFLLGFLTSFFSFGSVSPTFFLMRDLFTGGFMRGFVLPLILYYLLILVSIFIGFVLLLNLIRMKLEGQAQEKKSSDKHEKIWNKHYSKQVNLFIRLVVLVLGLILLFL